MDHLAVVCEEMQRNSSRLKQGGILAEYLKALTDGELAIAVELLSAGPVAQDSNNHTLFAVEDKPRLSIGRSVLREALQIASGWDKETLGICHAQVGDTGETIGLLMRGIAAEATAEPDAADDLYQQLFRAPTTARRRELLLAAFANTGLLR